MAMMSIRKSRLTPRQQGRLIEHFVAGSTARAAIRFVMVRRQRMASQLPSYHLCGEMEADDSYFGGARKGKRGRGAGGKSAVFGRLKRGGKVYTAIIPNVRTKTRVPIIEDRVEPDSIVYTDTFKASNARDASAFHHRRINHSKLLAKDRNPINGIENFCNPAKQILRKYNGIKPDHFYGFLKECEWRFNGGNHGDLLKQLRA